MDELSSTTGIVALAAGALALVARRAGAILSRSCARCARPSAPCSATRRRGPRRRTPPSSRPAFRALRDHVEVAERIDERLGTAEARLDHAIAYCGLVRYDAYNEMSGRQSTSIALLDSSRSGVVLSSIHHRDQARVYAKQIPEGKGELKLSPEEEEALRLALAS